MLIDISASPAASPEMLCLLADTYLANGAEVSGHELIKSQELLDRAVRLDPEWGNAWKIMAQICNIRDKWDQAVQLCNKALSVKKPDKRAYLQRALAYDSLGKSKECLADMTTYIEQRDHGPDMWTLKAQFLLRAHRTEEAIAAYREAQKQTFRDWTAFRITECYEKNGRYAEAIKEVSTLIKMNSQDPEAFQVRGRLEGKAKLYKEAIDDYAKAIALEPNARFYRERAALLKLTGQPAAAEADLKKALKSDPIMF